MDYKRIEWIFLVVFIAINIFLGVEISLTPAQLSDSQNASVTNISQEMATDNITVPKSVSNTPDDGYYLAAKTNDDLKLKLSALKAVKTSYGSDRTLYAALSTPVALSSQAAKALQQVKAFKNNSRRVPYGKQYLYSSFLSNGQEYVFIQNSDFGFIYDNGARLTITVQDHHIVGYTQRYVGAIAAVRERQATISASHAIKSLYTYSELSNNSRIRWIKLGYSKLTQVRGNTIFLPTWVILVENKSTKNVQIKRVNAFSGAVMQNLSYSE